MDPEIKVWTLFPFIFPTKHVIPKSLKFSHWPSKLPETNSSPYFRMVVGRRVSSFWIGGPAHFQGAKMLVLGRVGVQLSPCSSHLVLVASSMSKHAPGVRCPCHLQEPIFWCWTHSAVRFRILIMTTINLEDSWILRDLRVILLWVESVIFSQELQCTFEYLQMFVGYDCFWSEEMGQMST